MGVDVDLATCTNSSFLCLGQRREVQKTALEDMGSDIPPGKEKNTLDDKMLDNQDKVVVEGQSLEWGSEPEGSRGHKIRTGTDVVECGCGIGPF